MPGRPHVEPQAELHELLNPAGLLLISHFVEQGVTVEQMRDVEDALSIGEVRGHSSLSTSAVEAVERFRASHQLGLSHVNVPLLPDGLSTERRPRPGHLVGPDLVAQAHHGGKEHGAQVGAHCGDAVRGPADHSLSSAQLRLPHGLGITEPR